MSIFVKTAANTSKSYVPLKTLIQPSPAKNVQGHTHPVQFLSSLPKAAGGLSQVGTAEAAMDVPAAHVPLVGINSVSGEDVRVIPSR